MGIFDKKFDAFISYKSKNADTARFIADLLIASGKKVWFAEYQVLLTDRDRFQEAIDKGIRKCKYGIALTNDDYADSEYCGREMKQLLEFCGTNNIMEIMIPSEPKTHQKYEQLENASAYIFTGNADETINFISQITGWKIAPRIEVYRKHREDIFEGDCLGEAYTIDVTGWELIDKSFHGGGPCYVHKVEGRDIFWNLQFGEDYSPRVYEARRRLNQQNERAIYNEICDYANHYFRDLKTGYRIVGVHLLYIEGISHFAVTYYDGKYWKRRYSIMLVHSKTYNAAEFVFTFQFSGPFKQYCRYVELMDDLVMALKWGESKEEVKDVIKKKAPLKPSQKEGKISRIIEDQPMANKFNDEGLKFAKQGHLKDAIESWEKVLEYTTLIEMRGAVLYNMGRAYEKMGNEKQAINYYEQSAEENPKQYDALCNIGSIYLRKSKPNKALKYLLEAVKRNPNDYITVNNIMVCYEDLGDVSEAVLWRSKLRRLKPPCHKKN